MSQAREVVVKDTKSIYKVMIRKQKSTERDPLNRASILINLQRDTEDKSPTEEHCTVYYT